MVRLVLTLVLRVTRTSERVWKETGERDVERVVRTEKGRQSDFLCSERGIEREIERANDSLDSQRERFR